MHATADLWAAAQLVAFANLNVTAANWRSLWNQGDYLTPRLIRAGVRPSGRNMRRAGRTREADASDPPGELFQAFVDNARGMAAGREGQQLRPVSAADALRFTLALPATDRDGKRIGESEFRALHRRTRDWLFRICVGADDLGDLMSALRRYRVEYQLSILRSDERDPFRMLTHAGRPGSERAGWTWRTRNFALIEPLRVGRARTLAAVLEGLFVQAGLAGMWPRFFQCSAPRCVRFGLARVVGRAQSFCSVACRVRVGRVRPLVTRAAITKRAKAKEEWARRERFAIRWRELQAKGDREAWEKACAECGYGPLGPAD